MLQTLGPATPPEAFLYRGNAYYALGFPYFALADYNSAARFLSALTPEAHQDKCWSAVKVLPPTQRAVYPGCNSHLHICVRPFLDEKCDVETTGAASRDDLYALQDSRLLSRRAVAREAFSCAGLEVMKPSAAPWLQYPLEEGVCSRCCTPLSGGRTFACTNASCHEEYCSRDCRQLAAREYHAAVCGNRQFQEVEIALFEKMRESESAVTHRERAALLLSLRVLAAALVSQASPTALPQLRILSGVLTFAPRELCGDVLTLYQRVSQALGIATSVSFEEFIGLYARMLTNADWGPDSSLHGAPKNISHHTDSLGKHGEQAALRIEDRCGVSLHLPLAVFNHSCDPNCGCDVPTAVADGLPGLNAAARGASTTRLLTLRRIEAGEELTRSYFPLSWLKMNFEKRRGAMSAFHFRCRCKKCLAKE